MIYQGDALSYIWETPEILKEILEKQDDILAESIRLFGQTAPEEIYLAGSGSSYHSAVAASKILQKILGIRVFTAYPVPFLAELPYLHEHAALLGISQQGTSTAVIRALDRMKASGRPVISMTGEYNTEITVHGDANIYVECGYEDAGATTKGYTATAMTLMLFGMHLAKATGKLSLPDYLVYQKRIRTVVENMQAVLEQSRTWCEETARRLKLTKELIIIAGSNQTPALMEGVLKFSETCRFPVRGYEAEEFMHGMYNAVNRETEFLYLFPSEGEEAERMRKLYEYYQNQGNLQYGINTNGQFASDLNGCFVNDPDFSALEYSLPLQMLFVLTSRARGIDLNVPRDPDFHKYMGSKLEEMPTKA